MIVTMTTMLVVQMTIYQVVNMITMWHSRVPAIRAMHVIGFMTFTAVT